MTNAESIENESHLRSVIEQLQARNRALEREARNARAIIGSLKAAMREDSEHFFEQEQETRHLKREILKFIVAAMHARNGHAGRLYQMLDAMKGEVE